MKASRNKALPHTGRPAWRWVSERGLRVATGDATLAYYAALRRRGFPELEDAIPADCSLLLVLRRGAEVSAALWAELAASPAPVPAEDVIPGRQPASNEQFLRKFGATDGRSL